MNGQGRWAMVAALVAVVLPTLIGCGPTKERMGRYTFEISAQSGIPSAIEVDAVGVNSAKQAEWAALDVSNYFRPGTPRRQSEIKRTVTLSPNSTVGTISVSDPVWNEWLGENASRNNGGIGARSVFFVARMPRPNAGTALDTRLLEVPLSQKFWTNGQTIKIQLTPAGLREGSARKPQEN